MRDLYILSVKSKWSKYNSEYYYDIELINSDDGELYRTYVSPSNNNYKLWEEAIDTMESCDDVSVNITGNFKLTKKDRRIINADVIIKIEDVYPLLDVVKGIHEIHYKPKDVLYQSGMLR